LIVVLEWGTFLSNNIYIVFGNIPVHLVKFERNFTKCNFYVITEFMSKRNFYFETQGVDVREHEIQTKQHPRTVLDCCVGIRHVYQRESERDLPSILASHQFAAVSQGPRLCSRTHTKPPLPEPSLANPRIRLVPPQCFANTSPPRTQLRPKTDRPRRRSWAELRRVQESPNWGVSVFNLDRMSDIFYNSSHHLWRFFVFFPLSRSMSWGVNQSLWSASRGGVARSGVWRLCDVRWI
jgi:hypothetical protein